MPLLFFILVNKTTKNSRPTEPNKVILLQFLDIVSHCFYFNSAPLLVAASGLGHSEAETCSRMAQ